MSTIADVTYLIYFVGVFVLLAASVAAHFAPRLLRWGRAGAVTVAVVGLLGLAARSAVAGHLPIFGTFENTYTASWFVLAAGAFASVRFPAWSRAWRLAPPWAAALLAAGTAFRADTVPLTISEQSIWVDVHVLFAWVAFAGLLGATSLSLMRLVGRPPADWTDDEVDERVFALLGGGFVAFTVMLALGSFYAWILFGTFWSWDIVETLCLAAWLAYGLVIHFRLFYRWGGTRLDLAVVAVLPLLIAGYFVWSVFPATFHYFDVPLVRPY
ncbi:MAG: cytochrome c biogenesis protein CcsA [Coriobacteriia bacterium]